MNIGLLLPRHHDGIVYGDGRSGRATVKRPGPAGEPLDEWIDVREVMSAAPSDD